MSAISQVFLQLLSNLTATSSRSLTKLSLINEIIAYAELDSQVDTIAYFGRLGDVEPYITAMSGIPKVIVTDCSTEINFSGTAGNGNDYGYGFNRNILFIAVGRLDRKSLWTHLNRAFTDIQGQVRGVFIFSSDVIWSMSTLKQHFVWCWRWGFANVLALVDRRNGASVFDGYSYSRFPEMRILSVDLSAGRTYFPEKFSNFRGYKVRSPVLFDPPRVFEMLDRYNNQTRIKGYAGDMFQAFLSKHNGGLEIVQPNNSSQYNMLAIVEQLNMGDIDFSMNPYIPYNGVRLSYPIQMMQWCVLVPFSGEIDTFEYFVRPFQLHMWQSCVAALLYLTFMKGVSNRLNGQDRSKMEFGRSFLEMLRLMLFLPIPTTKFAKYFRWHYSVFHLQVAILGFVLSNLYIASLTSFLAKLIFDPQLDTLAEMVQRNLSINAIDYEIPLIRDKRGLPKGFADLLVPCSATRLVRDIIQLKAGHAYICRDDMANFAFVQQNHLLRPHFHVAGECIASIPVGFMMPKHSQFESVLNRFVMRSAASGLTDKWFLATVSDGFRAGILTARKEPDMLTRSLNLQHFQFAWIVLAGGSSLAVICCAVEIVWTMRRRLRIFIIYY